MWIQRTRMLLLGGILAGIVCLSVDLYAHEIVGDVTGLMIHMKRALLLIENGKPQKAVKEIQMVYKDFSHDMGMGMKMEGVGLKTMAGQIDQRFGTKLGASLDEALKEGSAPRLQKSAQELAFLLMLEKFGALQSTFRKKPANPQAQQTVFWLGRNYFSYLLEPTLARTDPIEEKRLSRLLDRMLGRLEDGQREELVALRVELVRGVEDAFDLDRPAAISEGSHLK